MEVTFKGLHINVANNYLIVDIDGWEDLPDVTNGSSPKPTRMGSQLGGLTSPKRVITLTLDILGDPESDYLTVVPKRNLRKVMTLDDAESELRVDLGFGMEPEIAYVRVTALDMPTSMGYGYTQRAVIEFEASDPRRYSPIEYTARTGIPTPVHGVDYPIQYGRYLTVLTPANRGEAMTQNAGNTPTPAVYTLRGPGDKTSLTVTNGEHVRKAHFNLKLAAQDQLRIDTKDGSITLNGSARYGITTGALVQDLELPAGVSAVKLETTGGTNSTSLVVAYRDANL